MLHGRVNPNQQGDVEDMERLAKLGVVAFKTYTQWGPDGKGFFMTDDVGIAFVEQARKVGVRNICIHKGLPFGQKSYEHSTSRDIGPIAKRFPDVNFLIYHSGYVAGKDEGPYDPKRTDGIDALVTSVLNAGVKPNSNVYAELGSTWRFLSMRDPTSAAHALGKLFKYIGEDNVLWGTDSIWYGSPQDQIQAFRTFQIADELREKHGYPTMTPALRAKVFGLNAAKPYKLSPGRHPPRDRKRRGRAQQSRVRGNAESVVRDVRPAHAPRVPEPAAVARRGAVRRVSFLLRLLLQILRVAFRFDALAGDLHADLVADLRHERSQAEVGALQRRRRLEADSRQLSAWIRAHLEDGDIERDGLGDAVQIELAGHLAGDPCRRPAPPSCCGTWRSETSRPRRNPPSADARRAPARRCSGWRAGS